MTYRCVGFHEKSRKNIDEIVRIQEKAESNPLVEEYGYNTKVIFDWMYKKATNEIFDMTKPVTEAHVKLFKREWKKFQENWGNNDNWFTRLFSTPHRISSKNPEMIKLIEQITNAFSYREGHIKTSQGFITDIIKNIDKITKSKGDKEINKEIRRLEKKVSEGGPDHAANIMELKKYMADREAEGEPTLLAVSRVMDGKKAPVTQEEIEIDRNWNNIRKESLNTMLSSFGNIRSLVSAVRDGEVKENLQRILDKIKDIQNQMLFQQEIDKRWVEYDENNIPYWMDSRGVKREFKAKDTPKFETKYRPLYTLELVKVHDELLHTISGVLDSNSHESASRLVYQFEQDLNLNGIINRAKQRGEEDYVSSIDPIYYLNKYVTDIAHHNFATKVNLEMYKLLKRFGSHLTEVERDPNKRDAFTEVAEYVVKDLIPELQESIFSTGSKSSLEHLVRSVNAFEYSAKIGINPRSALKNLTQKFFNLNHWGAGIYRLSHRFYNEVKNTSLGEKTNSERLTNQQQRFDIRFGRQMAARLEGSLDPNVVPKGYEYTKTEGLQRTESTPAMEATSRFLQKIAEKAGGLHGWVETSNRNGTFKLGFAYHFELFNRHKDVFQRQWMEQKKTDRQPTPEQLSDYIEHLAGNAAYHTMGLLHFDYNNWAKSKILKGKTGRVVGQFMHYTFQQFDLHASYVFDMLKHAKAGKFGGTKISLRTGRIEDALISQEMRRPIRLLGFYGLTGSMEAFLGIQLGGIIENDVMNRVIQFAKYMMSNPEEEPGHAYMEGYMSEQAKIMDVIYEKEAKRVSYRGELQKLEDIEKKYQRTYGKPIWANYVGPLAGDALMLADLFDIYNMTPDVVQERLNLNRDLSNPKWWRNVARIFSTAITRWSFDTLQTGIKAGLIPALKQELGFYTPTQESIGWIGKATGYDPYTREEKGRNLLQWGRKKLGPVGKILIPPPKRSTKKDMRLMRALDRIETGVNENLGRK